MDVNTRDRDGGRDPESNRPPPGAQSVFRTICVLSLSLLALTFVFYAITGEPILAYVIAVGSVVFCLFTTVCAVLKPRLTLWV